MRTVIDPSGVTVSHNGDWSGDATILVRAGDDALTWEADAMGLVMGSIRADDVRGSRAIPIAVLLRAVSVAARAFAYYAMCAETDALADRVYAAVVAKG